MEKKPLFFLLASQAGLLAFPFHPKLPQGQAGPPGDRRPAQPLSLANPSARGEPPARSPSPSRAPSRRERAALTPLPIHFSPSIPSLVLLQTPAPLLLCHGLPPDSPRRHQPASTSPLAAAAAPSHRRRARSSIAPHLRPQIPRPMATSATSSSFRRPRRRAPRRPSAPRLRPCPSEPRLPVRGATSRPSTSNAPATFTGVPPGSWPLCTSAVSPSYAREPCFAAAPLQPRCLHKAPVARPLCRSVLLRLRSVTC